ncbi:MAG: hypothetical protein ABEJ30_06050 [Halorientalis sp.]
MGRLVRLKQLLTGDGREATYTCLTCHARLDRQHQVCPECGGYDIRRVEWLDRSPTADS